MRKEEIKDDMVILKDRRISKRLWLDIAIVSTQKFVRDAKKYGDWCVFPRCDICDKKYSHYYVKDDVWKKANVSGWICPSCLSKKTPVKESDLLQEWINLFEVKVPGNELDRRLNSISKRKKCISFFDILRVVYGISRNEYDELKKISAEMEFQRIEAEIMEEAQQ